jgi:hypothetical protein
MKFIKSILAFFVLSFIFVNTSWAQFDKTQLQFGFGISEPFGNTSKGTYYMEMPLGSTRVLAIDSNFMTNNYALKTGINLFGKAKFNFDKYSITRGVIHAGFTSFNTFEPSKSGNIGVRVININNQIDTVLTSVNYSYSFGSFAFGLGFEVAPISFTNLISPYFSVNGVMNIFSGKLARTENRVDSVIVNFGGFRIGANFDAGIEFKFNKTFGLALGVRYDLGNLLLKNTNSGISDAIEWGKQGASLNDEEGRFYSSIYGPVLSSDRWERYSSKKDINWGTVYIAANIYLLKAKTKKPKK